MPTRRTPNRWLDRRIAAPGPYLTLCLSEQEFRQALRHLRTPLVPKFVKPPVDASTHFFDNPEGKTCAIVCMHSGWRKRKPIEVAGLLVHEAVHVWQQYCHDIGERSPGDEQEAYAIQSISQELLAEFARRRRTFK